MFWVEMVEEHLAEDSLAAFLGTSDDVFDID